MRLRSRSGLREFTTKMLLRRGWGTPSHGLHHRGRELAKAPALTYLRPVPRAVKSGTHEPTRGPLSGARRAGSRALVPHPAPSWCWWRQRMMRLL